MSTPTTSDSLFGDTSQASDTVSVTTSATLIFAADQNVKERKFHNPAAVTVWTGHTSAVTAANGIPVVPQAIFIDDHHRGDLYGVVSAGTALLHRQVTLA